LPPTDHSHSDYHPSNNIMLVEPLRPRSTEVIYNSKAFKIFCTEDFSVRYIVGLWSIYSTPIGNTVLEVQHSGGHRHWPKNDEAVASSASDAFAGWRAPSTEKRVAAIGGGISFRRAIRSLHRVWVLTERVLGRFVGHPIRRKECARNNRSLLSVQRHPPAGRLMRKSRGL